MDGEKFAARMQALRAQQIREDDGRSVVVGIGAVAVSQVFIVATLVAVATSPWFWVHTALIATAVVATLALLTAYHLKRPADADLIGRWMPLAHGIANLLSLTVILSPWVLLPLVGAVMSGVFYLLYAWFLAVTATFSKDPENPALLPLLGVPVSLSAYLVTADAPHALPLAIFFCLFGFSLCFFERQRRRMQGELLKARIAGERAAADLLQRLEAMSLVPNAVSSDAPPDDLLAGGILTPRQLEVLRHVARGRSNKEIARELKISPATVKVHVAQILATTGAGNRTAAAVAMARQA